MTLEGFIYLVVFAMCLLTWVQGLRALWDEVLFYRYIKRAVAKAPHLLTGAGEFKYQPRAVIVLPCCGVDEELERTVQALARQNYADYEVVFSFESTDDPAYAAVGRWTADWTTPRCRRVVAGQADRRAQKIHNLLAAVAVVSADREVLAFLDSDVVPDRNWLGHLVSPLEDETVGAATGYRWYGATGGLAAAVRCVWNASTISLMHDERRCFCWGGATALRTGVFEALGIARYWDRALSDDLQVTRAVREGGLRIRFVPQALVASSDRTTLRAFWSFARRQLVITRIYAPSIWRSGLILTSCLMAGGTATAALFVVAAAGWWGSPAAMIAALVGWLGIMILVAGKPILRQLAIRKVLRAPDWTWRDFWWDVCGTLTFAGALHMGLFAASLTSRRITWRRTEYELVSADETRVLRRGNGRSCTVPSNDTGVAESMSD